MIPSVPPVDILAIGVITLTPKQKIAWQKHLECPELRRHLFYGGARSGKTDVILAWLCVQAAWRRSYRKTDWWKWQEERNKEEALKL